LGEGITSRYPRREDADPTLLRGLHARAHAAGALLGAREVALYNMPDNRFDTVPMLDIVKIVEELVDRLQPSVIYTHHGGDLNVDHGVVHRAVLTATRPIAGKPVKDIYAFEVPSSTEWAFQQFNPIFRPNTFIDIGHTLEKKIQAMEAYESEARKFPHPRAPESLRTLAMRWGSVVGVAAAEALELVRSIH